MRPFIKSSGSENFAVTAGMRKICLPVPGRASVKVIFLRRMLSGGTYRTLPTEIFCVKYLSVGCINVFSDLKRNALNMAVINTMPEKITARIERNNLTLVWDIRKQLLTYIALGFINIITQYIFFAHGRNEFIFLIITEYKD